MKNKKIVLSDEEIYVLRYRFGLNDKEEIRTFEQIAVDLGYSREKVRQMYYKAKMKLERSGLLDNSLDGYS